MYKRREKKLFKNEKFVEMIAQFERSSNWRRARDDIGKTQREAGKKELETTNFFVDSTPEKV